MALIVPDAYSPAFTQPGNSAQRMSACAYVPASRIPELAALPVNLAAGATLTTSPILVAGLNLFSYILLFDQAMSVSVAMLHPVTFAEFLPFYLTNNTPGLISYGGGGYTVDQNSGFVFDVIALKFKNNGGALGSITLFPGLWLMTR